MSTPNDGGPAFPQGHLNGPEIDPSGMTLRDYFAAKAMQGFCANTAYCNADAAGPTPKHISEWAYEQADAMIERRQRQ